MSCYCQGKFVRGYSLQERMFHFTEEVHLLYIVVIVIKKYGATRSVSSKVFVPFATTSTSSIRSNSDTNVLNRSCSLLLISKIKRIQTENSLSDINSNNFCHSDWFQTPRSEFVCFIPVANKLVLLCFGPLLSLRFVDMLYPSFRSTCTAVNGEVTNIIKRYIKESSLKC